MVCLGNICRSPIAEGIMRDLINSRNLNAMVDSAGTIDFHKGEAPDLRAIKKAKQHGIDISDLRARPFVAEDFEIFDKIYVMDKNNYDDITSRTKTVHKKDKVIMIMNEVL